MTLNAITAIVFDWAGTTVDYGSCGPTGVLIEVFGNHRIQISQAEAREPMGLHKRDHVRALLAMPSVAGRWREAHGRDPTEADVEQLYGEVIPLQVACLPRYAVPIPGVLDLVASLRGYGIRLGSTTGYNREMLDTLSSEAGRLGYRPDVQVSADEVKRGRPAPYMCWEALTRLDAWPVSSCVKVGDTPSDIQAGRNAGMWTVGVSMTGNEIGLPQEELEALPFSRRRLLVARAKRRLLDAGAHAVVDGAADLMGVLPDIAGRIARGTPPG